MFNSKLTKIRKFAFHGHNVDVKMARIYADV